VPKCKWANGVLLHKGNKKPTVPVARTREMKGTFESMSHIPNAIKYKEHYWQLCGDLKDTVFVLEFQDDLPKNWYFLYYGIVK
jgi:hypothetical protein